MKALQRIVSTRARKWSDINFEDGNVDITPVKNGGFRTLPISNTLMHMLKMLPENSEYVFKKGILDHFREGFRKHRVKLSAELGEPEILKCSFKTLRTFYGIKISYIFNDPFEVQYRMGHTNISTTLKYIRRSRAMNRNFDCKTTRTVEEAEQAIKAGFGYVTEIDSVRLWRKPK